MTKAERAKYVIKTLQELYPTVPIPLDHKDAYTLLIAVLLSAQCTDVRVNQITPLLFAKADNPYDMVKVERRGNPGYYTSLRFVADEIEGDLRFI
jgi:endonuclease-3